MFLRFPLEKARLSRGHPSISRGAIRRRFPRKKRSSLPRTSNNTRENEGGREDSSKIIDARRGIIFEEISAGQEIWKSALSSKGFSYPLSDSPPRSGRKLNGTSCLARRMAALRQQDEPVVRGRFISLKFKRMTPDAGLVDRDKGEFGRFFPEYFTLRQIYSVWLHSALHCIFCGFYHSLLFRRYSFVSNPQITNNSNNRY